MPHGPEDDARDRIDEMLREAGWAVQDPDACDPGVAEEGIALREYPFESGTSDYLLVVDREAVGVIEAKPEGPTLGGVAEQSQKYATSAPNHIPPAEELFPFVYESTGVETNLRDLRDPSPRAREVFHFHWPGTLADWVGQAETLRARLQRTPPLQHGTLRDCQYEAIQELEKSFASNRPCRAAATEHPQAGVQRSVRAARGGRRPAGHRDGLVLRDGARFARRHRRLRQRTFLR